MVSNIDKSTREVYVQAAYNVIRGELGPLSDALGGLEIVMSDNWGAEEVPEPNIARIGFQGGDHWSEDVTADPEPSVYDLYTSAFETEEGQVEFHWFPEKKVFRVNSCDLAVIAKDDYTERMGELVLASEKMAWGLRTKIVEFEELHDQEMEYFKDRPDYTIIKDMAFKEI